jgi:hypothetical protein
MSEKEIAGWQSAIAKDVAAITHLVTVNEQAFLGEGDKGIYVTDVGGLPVFASGARIDIQCTKSALVFDEPCDETHISVSAVDGSVRCARSSEILGARTSPGKYTIDSRKVRFLRLSDPWPVSSQPENFWGSEGQYRSWNRNELSKRPLSY